MKLTLLRSDLMSALTLAGRAVDAKPTMPVLSHVLLTADPAGTLRASATNLSRSITATTSAQVSRGGSVALPSSLLASQVGAMPDGEVTITVDEKAVATLTASKRKVKVLGMSGEDFPTVKIPTEPLCTVKADAFASLIRRVQHALSEDETRPHLQSLHLVATGGTLRAEATNGHVACVAEMTAPGIGTWSTLLHETSLPALRAVLTMAGDATITLGCERRGDLLAVVSITHGGSAVATKTTDAQFPSIAGIMDEKTRSPRAVLIQDTKPLLAILSAVGSMSRSGVLVSLEGDTLVVSGENHDAGDARDELQVTVTGEATDPAKGKRFGISTAYITAALRAAGAEATIYWNEELEPIWITSESGTEILMPMRV